MITRGLLSTLLLFVVLTAVPPLAAVSATSPVPVRVQHAIKRAHPSLAYAPSVLPSAYSYQLWKDARAGYDIYFGREPRVADLGFHVLRASCASFGHAMATYRVNGLSIKWNGTYEDQQAFRCISRNLVMSATRSVAGDSPIKTAAQKRDALDLVRLVAYAKPIAN